MEIETEEQQIARLRAAEPPEMRKLRYLLAVTFAGWRLYRDDGEYSDAASGIDFRRDSVPEIERKMHAYNKREAERLRYSDTEALDGGRKG